MTDRDTLAVVAEELGQAFSPVRSAFSSPASFTSFMLELGWDLSAIPSSFQPLIDAASSLEHVLSGGPIDSSSFPRIVDALRALIDAADGLRNGGGLPGSVDAATFVNEFPVQVIDYLVVRYLLDRQPGFGALLRMLGVIRLEEVAAAAKRPEYLRRSIGWDDLSRVLEDPGAVFRNAYRWGQSDFAAESFLRSFTALMTAWGFPTKLEAPDSALDGVLNSNAIATDHAQNWVVRIPILEAGTGDASLEAGVGLFMLPETPTAKPGFSVLPYARGEATEAFQITRYLKLLFEGAFDVSGGAGILVRPDKPAEVVMGFDTAAGAQAASSIALSLVASGTGGVKLMLLGSRDASRFEMESLSLRVGGRGSLSGGPEAFGESELKGAAIVIKPAAGATDGFLVTLLPKDGFSIDFDLLVGISSKTGFYFGLSAGLEIALPAHISVGPIEIDGATVTIKLKGKTIPVELGATIRAELGPLQAVVEDVGLRVTFSFPPDRRGSMGVVDAAVAFKPPKGVGLAVDAGSVKGGGYLYFDFDKEEYAGALELVISNFLTLTAVGLVTTRMPDGSKGFSLLIIITAEFGTGIQIGFGFTLIGVGGLLGLNRTVRLQPLADGVRTGAVNNIMFPKNVVANAPRIISDLRAIFPPFEGKFLIGPMAKLGWGSPPLITLSLGIIIEIPGNLAILGVLKCILPDEKAPVLVLQVAFVGAIEFDKKRLWLFAAIFDSKVLTFTLEGEMGLLFAWGDAADFVLSVGGFHPRFKPPPLPFPSPKRLAITILDQSQARIRVSCYFAVTTNTVQFGAHAELYFGFSAISVEGDFHFDALFQFSPFYFIIELGASVSLKVFGTGVFSISLEMALEGPTPWHAHGHGSISFFFFSISASFDETWGEEKDTTLPPVEVFPLLAAELVKEPNWSALPPKSANLFVSLRVVGETKEFVLHPVGTLRVTQRTVPLNSTIDLLGAQKPSDANRFTLAVTTPGLSVAKPAKEQFAPAQFHAMSRAEKLAAPAFAQEDGGVDISASGNAMRSSLVLRRIVRYEKIIIDTNFKRFAQRFADFSGTLFNHFLLGNAAARSAVSARLKNQMQPFKATIETKTEGFGVANTMDNGMVAGSRLFGSYHAAKEHMDQAIAQNPKLAGTMHVVPDFEINKAA